MKIPNKNSYLISLSFILLEIEDGLFFQSECYNYGKKKLRLSKQIKAKSHNQDERTKKAIDAIMN